MTVRFEVFTVVTMKNGVFWDVMPWALVRTDVKKRASVASYGYVPSSPILVTLMMKTKFLRNVGSYESHTA
jgi:hypothetical protein